ncbi:D-aminoacyl-tRNA deacylase isoform X3 [Gastrolobium bilobum]|uniref:D-aminoacyl-tRNA deacylase isoform X3 n=1 Tax=Gastrolobium bilobum TaxID=150636 RepID=UPI002AAF61C6|nr:D-aminoacyl-tRNA deacylase isoform X3 [Gastrolobium bilobum]
MLLRTIRYCRARPQPILPAAKHFHHLLLPFPLPVFHLNRGLRSSKPVSIVSHINTSYSSSSSPSINQSPLSLSPSSSTSTHQRNKPNQSLQERETFSNKAMVALLVATTTDPASINPANALLAMPGWQPRPHFQDDMKSFVNEGLRVLLHGKSIVVEDDLDKRWEEVTGEVIDEVIFFSKHTAVSNKPALTVHPIGVPHLREGDVPPQGGKPGWAALPNPRIGPWLRLLKNMAQAHNLVPEFEITLEATHHGPLTNKPTMFLEIGSTEDYWKRQDAAQVMAQLVWEGLGLGGGTDVGNWSRENANKKVLLGIGGGHYVPRHMDVVLSFKSWQKNAITGFLVEQNIKIGKPNNFS